MASFVARNPPVSHTTKVPGNGQCVHLFPDGQEVEIDEVEHKFCVKMLRLSSAYEEV